MTNNKAK